jgi:predicted nucleotidyltransferase component of viral defense system
MKDFVLVGGTALSLLFGHRKSIDLDLFTVSDFSSEGLHSVLKEKYGDQVYIEDKPKVFGLFCAIQNIKVDLVRYPHPPIRASHISEGIRFISTEDIIAMKVQAVLGRARKKDFWDIATLLEHYSVADFIQFHKEKFSNQNLMITVPQAISYFSDAEDDVDPISLKGQTWESVKDFIGKKVREYLK